MFLLLRILVIKAAFPTDLRIKKLIPALQRKKTLMNTNSNMTTSTTPTTLSWSMKQRGPFLLPFYSRLSLPFKSNSFDEDRQSLREFAKYFKEKSFDERDFAKYAKEESFYENRQFLPEIMKYLNIFCSIGKQGIGRRSAIELLVNNEKADICLHRWQ